MKVKNAIGVSFVVLLIWCALSSVRPYWDRYWLGQDMERAAIYGTKNTIESTRKLLETKMKEKGRDFKGEDFLVEKDENKDVTVTITYGDEISIFGLELMELHFTVQKTARYIPAML